MYTVYKVTRELTSIVASEPFTVNYKTSFIECPVFYSVPAPFLCFSSEQNAIDFMYENGWFEYATLWKAETTFLPIEIKTLLKGTKTVFDEKLGFYRTVQSDPKSRMSEFWGSSTPFIEIMRWDSQYIATPSGTIGCYDLKLVEIVGGYKERNDEPGSDRNACF